MRFLLKVVLAFVTVVGALFLVLVVYLRIGPTGPVPKIDPVFTLNQQHVGLTDNAAEIYLRAFQAYVDPPNKEWLDGDVIWADESEAVASWLTANAEAIELTQAAAERAECWFALRRTREAFPDLREVLDLKELIKLCRLRADFEAQSGKWHLVAKSLQTMDAVSRHALEQPAVISHLVGISGLGMEMAQIRRHLASPKLTATGRDALLSCADFAFEPPPSPAMALQTERDMLCWQLSRDTPAFVLPAGRVAGEIDRYVSPYLKLAAQTPEQMLDPGHPLQIEARRLRAWKPSFRNPVRSVVAGLIPSLGRVLMLHARLIAEQRGTQTLHAILRYQLEHGEPPDDLETLASGFVIDPFTAKPFIYRHTADGFTLYCAGLDRDDDGGLHHQRFGERSDGRADGDYVFWPLPE